MTKLIPLQCLVVLIFSVSPASAQSLAGDALLKTFTGKSLRLACSNGTTAVGHYTVSRNVGWLRGTYKAADKPPSSEVGVLRARGEQLCLRFRGFNDGAERCFGVVQMSPTTYAFTVAGGLMTACQIHAS